MITKVIVQISQYLVQKRKQITLIGDYRSLSLDKKLLFIQLKTNGNIWITNPK